MHTPLLRRAGRRRLLALATAGAATCALAGCAETQTASGDVPAAFADVEPVTLRVPTLYGPGHYQTEALEEYGEAVSEATGGRVSFELYYQDSLVEPADTVSALADGVVDLSLVVPGYTPAEFPVDVWTSDFAFMTSPEPVVGSLQGTAAVLEWAFDEPDMMAEYERLGLVPIIPRFTGHDAYQLLCREPVVEAGSAEGLRGRVGGPNWSAEIEALGMVPVSLAGGEIYEGFQRGIIDCHVGSGPDMVGLGLWDVGKHYTQMNFSGFASGGLMVSSDTWDRLELPVQQALWDHAGVYLEVWHEGWLEGMRQFFVEGAEKGVQFHEPAPALAAELERHHERVLAEAPDRAPTEVSDPEAFIERFQASYEKWLPIVENDLGFDTGTDRWADWAATAPEEIELDAWVDHVQEHILDPRRPS